MKYQILQPKRKVLLSQPKKLNGKYQRVSKLQSVIKGQQLHMSHSVQNRYADGTKTLFY